MIRGWCLLKETESILHQVADEAKERIERTCAILQGWEHKASEWHKASPVENSLCALPKDLGTFPGAGSRRSKSWYFYRTREQTEFSRNTAGCNQLLCSFPLESFR